MPVPASCAIVIFGASGDLARRKLIPAIYELAREGLLSPHTYVVGYARTPMSDQEFRQQCREAVVSHGRDQGADAATWASLEQRLYYAQGDYGSLEGHSRLRARLDELDLRQGNPRNRLYYLATPPEAFVPIIERLGQRQPLEKGTPPSAGGWQRIVIEKPFGTDLASARALNDLLHRYFAEEAIFRIDHFLGKETVQNLMVLRFANSILEPVWNYRYVDHVQITVAETLGVGQRGGYYDRSGALRDMVQNHMFQLLALVAMEPPVALDALSIRDEKVKVFKAIRTLAAGAVERCAVRGQYAGGAAADYRHEAGVSPHSGTETFAALKLFIDNWRWSGTPFYLRTGKMLAEKLSEVVVRFRSPPLTLFQKQCESPVYPNDLIIRVQPDEGISLRLNGKVPGGQLNIRPVAMNFQYKTTFHAQPPEAYQRLVHDAILGDQTLFIRADEAEAAWAVLQPILSAWGQATTPPQLYAPGGWGPARAFELIERDGRRWQHNGGDPEPIIACWL